MTGLGSDNTVRLLQRYKWARPLSILCLVVIFIDLTLFSSTNFLSKTLIIKNPESQLSRGAVFYQTERSDFEIPIVQTIQLPDEFKNAERFKPYSFEYLKIRQNKGILGCYDSLTNSIYASGIENQPNYPKYQGEFYLMKPDQDIKVENTFWSPNKLVFKITNVEKATNNELIINQNFYPGWIVRTSNNSCTRVTNSKDLIATKLDSSSDTITLEYNPVFLYLHCWR